MLDIDHIREELNERPFRVAAATKWGSKITTVALKMVLPGLAGLWLDNQLETRFVRFLGFAIGVPLGIWHLIAMTKSK